MAGAARQPEYRAGRSGFSREFYAVHIAAEAAPTVYFFLITINPQKQGIPSLGGMKQRELPYVTGKFHVESSSGY